MQKLVFSVTINKPFSLKFVANLVSNETNTDRKGFSEKKVKDRKIIQKNHMEDIISKKKNWDHMTEANMVEGPIERHINLNWIKNGKIKYAGKLCTIFTLNKISRINMVNF